MIGVNLSIPQVAMRSGSSPPITPEIEILTRNASTILTRSGATIIARTA